MGQTNVLFCGLQVSLCCQQRFDVAPAGHHRRITHTCVSKHLLNSLLQGINADTRLRRNRDASCTFVFNNPGRPTTEITLVVNPEHSVRVGYH